MIKLKSILLNENVLISRRNKEERLKYYRSSLYKKVKQYIKNGCKGDLNLATTPIDRLPDELKHIDGHLNLFNTQIKSLPDGLTIIGWLDLDNTQIKLLPNGLTVGGSLSLCDTQIKSLPNGLKVGNYLYLYNTPLSKKYTPDEIKQMIINKGGSVNGVKHDVFI